MASKARLKRATWARSQCVLKILSDNVRLAVENLKLEDERTESPSGSECALLDEIGRDSEGYVERFRPPAYSISSLSK